VFHLRVVDPDWLPRVKVLDGVHDVSQVDDKLVVSLEDPDATNPHIIRSLVNAGADVKFVGELRHSLEDIYLQTMGE
jgi:ABC-2 type transport system ATP-binding protein